MTGKSFSKRVIVEVKGGIGNQMFQYAAATALSLELEAELILENRLGFVLDRQYRGKFQLDDLPVSYSTSSFVDSLPFFVDRVKSFISRRTTKNPIRKNSRNLLFERDFDFMDFSTLDRTKNRYRLSGYYQDPRYFDAQMPGILNELTPATPTDHIFIELANLRADFDLIALGIRMYEESSSPEAHARGRAIKSPDEYQIPLAKLLETVANPLVLVFTSKEFEFLKSMELPSGSIFVNPDRGFTSTIDTLWLMSMCKHHIFNNSTFYWWGATLSQNNYKLSEQEIYCSDNFLNSEIAYPSWKKF